MTDLACVDISAVKGVFSSDTGANELPVTVSNDVVSEAPTTESLSFAGESTCLVGEKVSVFAWLLSSRNRKSCGFDEDSAASPRRSGRLADGATTDGDDTEVMELGFRPNPATRSAADTGRDCGDIDDACLAV